MTQWYQRTLFNISLAMLLVTMPTYAVEIFKVSSYGKGHQIWFEAEAFDERSPNENYKLGKAEKALKPADGAFGDIVTNAGGQGWLLYRFDISKAGGKKGLWRFWGRIINPNNHSDWLWVLGDDGKEIPQVPPALVRPDHIIFENNDPVWNWRGDGDFGADGGAVNKLQDGENVMMIWTRQSDLEDQYDVFMWADDPANYKPTDDDYKNAKEMSAKPVELAGKLATVWGSIKSAR